MRLFRASFLTTLLYLAATPAHAQSFEGTVTRDPNARLAIYDFQFHGPRNGLTAL